MEEVSGPRDAGGDSYLDLTDRSIWWTWGLLWFGWDQIETQKPDLCMHIQILPCRWPWIMQQGRVRRVWGPQPGQVLGLIPFTGLCLPAPFQLFKQH